jgi:hypothetical protein
MTPFPLISRAGVPPSRVHQSPTSIHRGGETKMRSLVLTVLQAPIRLREAVGRTRSETACRQGLAAPSFIGTIILCIDMGCAQNKKYEREAFDERTRVRMRKNHSTQDSRVVPHRGTNWAAPWLTSQIGRDAVLSRSYGRGYHSLLTPVYESIFLGHVVGLITMPFNPLH